MCGILTHSLVVICIAFVLFALVVVNPTTMPTRWPPNLTNNPNSLECVQNTANRQTALIYIVLYRTDIFCLGLYLRTMQVERPSKTSEPRFEGKYQR
jgi:hypothetical protein